MSAATPFLAAREVLNPHLLGNDPGQALVAAKCLGLLTGYDAKWKDAPYRIDSVESVMTSDLFNPETTRKSRSFTLAGKLDVRATEIGTGAKVLFDHKTASANIIDPADAYWKILAIEGQVSHYMLLEWLNQNKVDFAIWDVVKKATISPRLLSKKELAEAMESGFYIGYELQEQDREALKVEPRETPLMYAARLAHDCTVERPDWYLQRRKVPRLDAEIREYAGEVWDHSQDILATRQSGRWPRNSGACFVYQSPCRFLGICSGTDTADSDKWTVADWVHPELPILNNGRGLDILTNSRIRTFQSCRRKHYLQYELGIVRVEEEEKEALWYGNLWHLALETYFLALQKQQTGAL